ncbi:MAG: SDR family NAD(P)-dependent oxidoreductase [Bacteroidales bacterium]|nr:SDR family NAD(P)-dependent oxidoreductase [Bacteroidales bacterium]
MKIAIVTGAYGTIGKAIANGIAKTLNYRVIMLGRDPVMLRNAAEDVRKQSGNTEIIEGLLDLSLKKNIEAFAETISEPVHILVNNASTTPRQRLETEEGIEMQWAVNVLAYFRMIHAFTPHLAKAAGARVVNVASYWAGDLDLSDPEFKRRNYHNDTVYRQSKQADRMLTRSFAEMHQGKNISVNACHPGDVNSKLSNNLGYGGHETPEQGADTPVWLALSQEVDGITEKYFEHRQKTDCRYMSDEASVKKLFDICSRY